LTDDRYSCREHLYLQQEVAIAIVNLSKSINKAAKVMILERIGIIVAFFVRQIRSKEVIRKKVD